jgi:hypothetical protein
MNMRKCIVTQFLMLLLFSLTVFLASCSKKNEEQQKPSDIWNIDKDGIPKFVGTNYLELGKIYRISKFRSSVGHDYSDAFEHCRSMKHYFEPRSDIDWSIIKIFSPVTGIITRVDVEWAGTKIEIASDDYPAFRFSIFHINTLKQFNIGDKVISGDQLGTHIGSQTYSDISVMVNDSTRQGRLVSYFEVITDALFNEYSARGVINREELIIPKITRDANPLLCNGDTFTTTDTIENWVVLN